MNKFAFNRTQYWQLLIVLVLLLSLSGAGWYVMGVHQRAQNRMDDIAPRYARLLGMLEHSGDIDVLKVSWSNQRHELVYPPAQDAAQAGNDAQAKLRTLFADSKLEIGSIQVLSSKDEGAFDRIPLTLRVEGDWIGMQNALSLLGSQKPRIQLEGMSIHSIGAVKPASAQRLGGQFNFYVLRMRS